MHMVADQSAHPPDCPSVRVYVNMPSCFQTHRLPSRQLSHSLAYLTSHLSAFVHANPPAHQSAIPTASPYADPPIHPPVCQPASRPPDHLFEEGFSPDWRGPGGNHPSSPIRKPISLLIHATNRLLVRPPPTIQLVRQQPTKPYFHLSIRMLVPLSMHTTARQSILSFARPSVSPQSQRINTFTRPYV